MSVSKDDVSKILKESIVIDALTYIPEVPDATYFDRMLAANITAVHATFVEPYGDTELAINRIAGWYRYFRQFNNILLVKAVEDIFNAKSSRKVGIIAGMQNTRPIELNTDLVEVFYRLGIRVIQIAYYEQNYAGMGCYEAYKLWDTGLTEFGMKIVDECNRLGILIDLSHCGDKTSADVINYSKDPVAFTHANPRKLANHFRNKPDELIKAIAEKGGVIGVNAWSQICEIKKGVRPGVSDLVSHIDYIVKVAGIDHVGLGLDLAPGWSRSAFETWAAKYPELVGSYTYETKYAEGIEDHSGIFNIVAELMTHGYSEEEVKKILGGNWLRLFKKVWR
jgi:membrane dipeptidase